MIGSGRSEAAEMAAPATAGARSVGPLYWAGLWAIDLVSVGWFAIRALFRLRACSDIRILVYHDIADLTPKEDPLRVSVPVALFEQQMRFLSEEGYRFLSVEEAARLLSSADIPDRAVVVTFDDGYESVLRAAVPILNRYAVLVTLFVAVGRLGEARFPWSPAGSRFSRPLRWDELAELAGSCAMEIGSHTVTHRPLHTLSPAEQATEVEASRRVLEERLGRPVQVFAYPFGGWNTFPAHLRDLLRRHGYTAACTNVMGANVAGANTMALRRVRIGWNDSLWRFRLKLAGAYDWSDRARRVLASLRSGNHEKVESLENT
ncbi:MAG: polysaccharide deacetylase family protein [Nitrospirae bacterium]|nr:MAG: polysaccharide deacetylase family protein [Nitrospirota bacterium]